MRQASSVVCPSGVAASAASSLGRLGGTPRGSSVGLGAGLPRRASRGLGLASAGRRGAPSRENGMPSASSSAKASSSVGAEVVIVMSRPRTWSIES